MSSHMSVTSPEIGFLEIIHMNHNEKRPNMWAQQLDNPVFLMTNLTVDLSGDDSRISDLQDSHSYKTRPKVKKATK